MMINDPWSEESLVMVMRRACGWTCTGTYKEGAAGDTETVYMFGGRTLFLHLDVGEGLYLGTENVVGLYDITVCFSLNVWSCVLEA